MKYYLVAVFDENSSSSLTKIQKSISKKYKLYKNTPVLHIPLGVVNSNDFEKLDEALHKVLAPYKNFKIMIDNKIVFNDSFNTLGFKVEDKGYINKILRSVSNTFPIYNVNIKMPNNGNLNIPIANANHNTRKSAGNGTLYINPQCEKDSYLYTAKVCKFELWKQPTSNREMIKSYPLKEY
ncbi:MULTISPECIES: hypothetical protein [Clostridium]|uniref:2'-5' RNA ligase family protein n=1 Tax=Clostridium senegalense TaxID=1465809 RepID=A0A6M0H155_9CLOT|nr:MULTISPECIES: hypothetical protein [Clostridium]NEU04339.1 hypothetical protein [Clostridium senegalense]